MMLASPMRPLRWIAIRRRRSRSPAVTRDLRTIQTPAAISRMASMASSNNSPAPPSDIENYSVLRLDRLPGGGFLEDLGIILEELVEPFIGERMAEEHVEHLERHSRDMRARQSAIDNM